MKLWNGRFTAFLSLALTAVIISAANATVSDSKEIRGRLVEQAQIYFKSDSEILKFKRLHPEVIFKHPSLIDHIDVQTLRYHEVYVEKNDSGSREWEVFGAGADVHFNSEKNGFSFGKRLLNWTNALSLAQLSSEDELGSRITAELKLPNRIDEDDFSIHRKILVNAEFAVPVYWVEVLARALVHTQFISSGRVLVFSALDSSLLLNFSKHHALDIPEVKVKDGSKNLVYDNQSTSVDNSSSFIKKYKNSCQVISKNEDSVGVPLLINPNQCVGVIMGSTQTANADESASRAAGNSEKILNYYLENFNQYGFDNDRSKKTPIISIVHAGKHFDNAFWDPDLDVMVYGDGTGGKAADATGDYTFALDVAGHEFTHAIVSKTANLVVPGEPGALNEGFADVLGVLIRRSSDAKAKWNVGTQLYRNSLSSSEPLALRSLSDPEKYTSQTSVGGKYVNLPFPKKYSQRFAQGVPCTDNNDQCETHANSLIWSHSAYLINEALQENGLTAPQADGVVGKLFFTALTHRLHENSSMKEAAQDVLAACKDLYNERECSQVKGAFIKTELAD